ncbi:MAG: secondary thiamine-phosphate synthase enzyme YjbQ [Candidatus Zixiibacteriota bacterium]
MYSDKIVLRTKGFSDIIDITSNVEKIIKKSKVADGIASIFVIGSTASISTIEYEPALVKDMQEKLESLISRNERSRHSETWGDDNGFSHMRATLMGPGITVPIVDSKPTRGTWQQIIIIDHDNRPRERKIQVQIVGE